MVLRINDLSVEFKAGDQQKSGLQVLDRVGFDVHDGQTIGLVGESGCGKSVTALSIMGLLPRPHGQIIGGTISYTGCRGEIDLVSLPPEQLYRMRGNRISMIFQEPMTALNPVHTVEQQLGEVFQLHKPELGRKQRRQRILKMLEKVGVSAPETRLKTYPHQLSGGIRQRIMIAMALGCEPDILIADEPTTALDVTIQAQILELMRELQRESGMAILFITHDLGVVAEMCDQVVVMYAGRVVEQADVFTLFEQPAHPYTRGLLQSIPRLEHGAKQHLQAIVGTVPALDRMPAGCRFSGRCRYTEFACQQTSPRLEKITDNHLAACHRLKELI